MVMVFIGTVNNSIDKLYEFIVCVLINEEKQFATMGGKKFHKL